MLAQEAPGLHISFVAPPREDLTARKERGEIDLYIDPAEKVPVALKARLLLRDGFRMAQGKHHKRGTGNASLDDYCSLRHIMVSQKSNFSSPVDDALAALSKMRKVVVTVSSHNQFALVLSSTHCVATLPSRLLQKYATLLDILPLPFTMPPFEIAMVASQRPAPSTMPGTHGCATALHRWRWRRNKVEAAAVEGAGGSWCDLISSTPGSRGVSHD
jgi:DNA-binding transcriptional LysR family regulator